VDGRSRGKKWIDWTFCGSPNLLKGRCHLSGRFCNRPINRQPMDKRDYLSFDPGQ
jgi:hypothetical protein